MGRLARLTKEERGRAESLREEAADLQHKFWDTLLKLEQLIGVEVDSNCDLGDYSVTNLQSRGNPR